MTDTGQMNIAKAKLPTWFWIIAVLGLAWNVFGAVQFIASVRATEADLLAQGMTPAQASVMLGYPVWMTVMFAVGVFGGVVGCVLLLLRSAWAVPVFLASLVGYILLYIGDIVHGVFAALGTPQIAVLTLVVLIAAGLLWAARHFRKSGALA